MAPELVIFALALVLVFYWFRYNCRLILRANRPAELVRQVAAANHLSFLEVESELRNQLAAEQLEKLNERLSRDYRVLICLLRYTSGLKSRSHAVEQRMLMLDFKLMEICYVLTRRWIPPQAKRSMEERARILSHFAAIMGERSAAVSRA